MKKIKYLVIIGLVTISCGIVKAQSITTAMGSFVPGTGENIPPTLTSLGDPIDVFMDSTGNLYVTEFHRIRKFTVSTGLVTTVAGSGAMGFTGDGSPATNTGVRMYAPNGVAVDSQGNIYICDTLNNRIRKVTKSTGIISTIAGNGAGITTPLGDGGLATAARLNQPLGIFIDSSDNIYFADSSSHRVRKINHATGIITTIAGTGYYSTISSDDDLGLATAVNLYYPTDVTMDSSGNLYITNSGSHNVLKLNASTQILTRVAGHFDTASYSGDNGLAINAGLNAPRGVVVDNAGNVYFSDRLNHRIRKVNASTGIITTIVGTGVQGFSPDGTPGVSANINTPEDLFMTNSGTLYFADRGNNRIRKIESGNLSTVSYENTLEAGIYPNPVVDKIHFKAKKDGLAIIYSSTGSFIKNLQFKKGDNKFNISYLEKGVYLIKIEEKSYKLIKE
ncbi:T9SS type A sorting domain-containing protein [Chryseobacterium sp. MMS23-Vi53]|uniref:NHL domain-containing protein n=1 Tax=Chryseobacterium sp. MMS23-Vi53 TaxID=3386644 RepID=UPI0039E8D874